MTGIIVATFLLSSVFSSTVIANVTDSEKPVIEVANRIHLFTTMSYEKKINTILKHVQAHDNIDGDLSSKIKVRTSQDLTSSGIATVTLEVTDSAGNRAVKTATVYVYDVEPKFSGLTQINLAQNQSINLVEDVKAFDNQGEEIPFVIKSVEKIITKKNVKKAQYQLEKVSSTQYKATNLVDEEEGFYKVTYESTDSESNKRTATRYISTVVSIEPTILSIELQKNKIAPGEKAYIEIATAGIPQDAVLYVYYKLGDNFDRIGASLNYDSTANKFIGTIQVPQGYENNNWPFNVVSVDQKNGENIYFYDRNFDHLSHSIMVFNGNDEQPPVLNLPNKELTITRGEAFNALEGVSAFDVPDGELTSKIRVNGNVNVEKSGVYQLLYSVTDQAGLTTTSTRIITVQDQELPVIKISKKWLEAYIEQGEEALRSIIQTNATASDNEEGDISSNIEVKISGDLSTKGTKIITYSVKDRSGNTASEQVQLQLLNYPTENYIGGIENTTVLVGKAFDPLQGVKGIDPNGKTLKVDVIGTVDSNKIGSYELTYIFTNEMKQQFTYKRKVEVKNLSKPYFEGAQEISFSIGEDINPLQDLVAFDMHGNYLSMRSSGEYNANKLGAYSYMVEATDAYGQTVKMTRSILVKNNKNDAFLDVSTTHPFYKEILTMKEQGIINGYPGGKFGPTDAILRKHVASLIFRSGVDLTPIRAAKEFKDVPKTESTYNEIQALYRAGIIDGAGDYFYPNRTLTREELSKILVQAFKLQNKGGYENFFTDVSKNNWSYQYVVTLASHGITQGSYGKFLPKDVVSRQHYAAFMYRALENSNK